MAPTPCGVLYKIASELAGLRKYEEVDYCLLSKDNYDKKGRTSYGRALRTGTYRTREIIQRDPRMLDVSIFAPPYRAASDLLSYVKSHGKSEGDIVDYYVSSGAATMCDSLEAYGFDAYIFENAFNDVLRSAVMGLRPPAFSLTLLFVLTAFYGDPRSAYSLFVEKLERCDLGTDLCTGSLEVTRQEEYRSEYALVRKYDQALGTNFYLLEKSEDGTVLGRAGTSPCAINEVDASVSRKHARIYWEDDSFYVEGLGSVHGTWVRHPNSEIETVELPQFDKANLQESNSVKVSVGDEILLGTNTVFLLTKVHPAQYAAKTKQGDFDD